MTTTVGNDRLTALEERLAATLEQLRAAERLALQLAEAAYRDALTGARNRRWLDEIGIHSSAGVILLDLDGFKGVNDTYGHAAGDAVLAEVARRLEAVAPRRVARLGGDELVITTSDPDGLWLLAWAATGAIVGTPVRLPDGREVTVSASAGCASGAPGELLARADVAMYHAKRRGSGAAEWHPELSTPQLPRQRRSHRDHQEYAA